MNKGKVIFCWSGGKDSALALHEIRQQGFEVAALITTVTQGYERVSIHGVRDVLLDAQAHSIGIALEKVYIPQNSSNSDYESAMEKLLNRWYDRGVAKVVFGDIFLEDLRQYREKNLARAGMETIFPLWKQDSAVLGRRFIDQGFKAIITCVDTLALPASFCGRYYDASFLADLPASVDPCGENGEFHSFVFDGPIFKKSVPFKVGECVLRDNRFQYCDLLER